MVVNCVGIVKQRPEAKEAVPSILMNALLPHQLAEICQALGRSGSFTSVPIASSAASAANIAKTI